MTDVEQMGQILEELIGIVHDQTREMEKLVVNIERVVGPIKEEGRFFVLASELSELRSRLKRVLV